MTPKQKKWEKFYLDIASVAQSQRYRDPAKVDTEYPIRDERMRVIIREGAKDLHTTHLNLARKAREVIKEINDAINNKYKVAYTYPKIYAEEKVHKDHPSS